MISLFQYIRKQLFTSGSVASGAGIFTLLLRGSVIGTSQSGTATSTKTSPQNITLQYRKSFAFIGSRLRRTRWAKYSKNDLVGAVSE